MAARRRVGARLVATALAATTATTVTTVLLTGSSASASADPVPAPRVLVLGVSGLSWDDVTPSTPQLWRLAQDGAIAALVIRGVDQRTCAMDGWLTLGTGTRTVPPKPRDPDGALLCSKLPRPVRTSGSQWTIPGWAAIGPENADRYAPRLGLTADSLARAGQCATAAGPGAAVMLADADGVVDRYLPSPDSVTARVLRRCALTAVDLGELPPAGGQVPVTDGGSGAPITRESRQQALARIDAQVARLSRQAADDTLVVLTSTADETTLARVRVLAMQGPGPGGSDYTAGLLTTGSTRRPGLVLLTDVTPTVLAALDVPPVSPLIGTAPTVASEPTGSAARLQAVRELDERAQAMLRITFPINQALIVLALVMYAGFALVGIRLLRRRSKGPDVTPAAALPRRYCRALQVCSLALASIPVATYCTNLVPWWRLGDADGAIVTMLALAVVVALILTAVSVIPGWQRAPFRPVASVASVTVVVLALDVMTGSRLQFASVLGLSPIAAGRFYGFGNVAFSVFAASAIFATVAVSAPLVRAGRRTPAMLLVAAVGLLAGLLDGWPTFGADFGGMITLVTAFGVFALLVSGSAVTLRRVVLVLLAGAGFALVISLADWLRPPADRTHLGEFVASVLSGDAGATVHRKLLASLRSLVFTTVAPAIPVAWLALAFVVARPQRFRAHALRVAYQRVPTLQAGLVATLVVAGLGAVLNDSGIIVTATVLSMAVPLAVAAAAEVGAFGGAASGEWSGRSGSGGSASGPDAQPGRRPQGRDDQQQARHGSQESAQRDP